MAKELLSRKAAGVVVIEVPIAEDIGEAEVMRRREAALFMIIVMSVY
jgi:hypothetical protein